jgi:WD40 repeat protein
VRQIEACEEVVFSADGAILFLLKCVVHREPNHLEAHRRDGGLLWKVPDSYLMPRGVVCFPHGNLVAYVKPGAIPSPPDDPRSGAGVVVCEAATGKESRFIPCSQGCLAIALAPQGQWLATVGYDGLHVWDARAWAMQWQAGETLTSAQAGNLRGQSNIPARMRGGPKYESWPLTFSPDGRLLATGATANRILIWDAATGEVRRTLSGHEARVASLAFTPDGRRLISGSDDTTVLVWDLTLLDQ